MQLLLPLQMPLALGIAYSSRPAQPAFVDERAPRALEDALASQASLF